MSNPSSRPEVTAGPRATAVVRRYLEALGRQDWDALEATLAEDVHRTGPFDDVVEGRRAYRDFLQRVVSGLAGYELAVQRIEPVETPERGALDVRTCWVRLSETVDADGGRLRTEEALEFDVDGEGRIARVGVFTRRSRRRGPGPA